MILKCSGCETPWPACKSGRACSSGVSGEAGLWALGVRGDQEPLGGWTQSLPASNLDGLWVSSPCRPCVTWRSSGSLYGGGIITGLVLGASGRNTFYF